MSSGWGPVFMRTSLLQWSELLLGMSFRSPTCWYRCIFFLYLSKASEPTWKFLWTHITSLLHYIIIIIIINMYIRVPIRCFEACLLPFFCEENNNRVSHLSRVGVQFLCSYITLPLYALVTQVRSLCIFKCGISFVWNWTYKDFKSRAFIQLSC